VTAPAATAGWRAALVILALIAIATAFATGTILARLSYDSGVTPLTVSTTRTLAALLVLALVLRLRGAPLAPARPVRLPALALGLILAAYSFGLFVAVGLMPVALAIVVFYTWPFMAGIGAWLTGQERLTWLWPVTAATAFAGLVIALDVGGSVPDWRGVALALAGAFGWAVLLLLNRRLVGSADTRPVTLWMLLSAATVYVVGALVSGDYHLPRDTIGWVGLGGAAACYSFLPMSLFAVARLAGPVRTGLVMNFEPIASLTLGALLLGQVLAPVQILGMALVVAAVIAARGASRPAG
jgi:drug/metabolite transporter (DMT)-like permease